VGCLLNANRFEGENSRRIVRTHQDIQRRCRASATSGVVWRAAPCLTGLLLGGPRSSRCWVMMWMNPRWTEACWRAA